MQGAKHRALGLLKCSILLPSQPRASEQPRPRSALPRRQWVPGSCKALVGGRKINSQAGVSAARLVHPLCQGERVTFTAVPAWATCLSSMEWDLLGATACRCCFKPCCLQCHHSERGATPDPEQHGMFENSHSLSHRAVAMHCDGNSFLAGFLRGGGFSLLICQLPPVTAWFVSLLASLKHY